jgi:hypothetical membrane protein
MNTIETAGALKTLSLWSACIVVCSTLAAAGLYLPTHPGFSPLRTYLSEIGGAGGWPAAVFVAVVLTLRLREFGLSRRVAKLIIVMAFVTVSGIVLMTTSPFNVGPVEHKLGILLYFLATVIVMSVITAVEVRFDAIPRLLPALSGLVVLVYVCFAGQLAAWGAGLVQRTTPAPVEWMCFAASILWVVAHGLVLGSSKRHPV